MGRVLYCGAVGPTVKVPPRTAALLRVLFQRAGTPAVRAFMWVWGSAGAELRHSVSPRAAGRKPRISVGAAFGGVPGQDQPLSRELGSSPPGKTALAALSRCTATGTEQIRCRPRPSGSGGRYILAPAAIAAAMCAVDRRRDMRTRRKVRLDGSEKPVVQVLSTTANVRVRPRTHHPRCAASAWRYRFPGTEPGSVVRVASDSTTGKQERDLL